MQTGSPLIVALSTALPLGDSLEIPSTLIPTVSLPLALQAVLPTGSGFSMVGVLGSCNFFPVINQGASTGVQASWITNFDKGVYRIQGSLHSTNFVGPAASSASPFCARINLYPPGINFATPLAVTALQVGVPQTANFDVTIFFPNVGWEIQLDTHVATGVGESIGAYANVLISQLI